jgi:hypothetical protein
MPNTSVLLGVRAGAMFPGGNFSGDKLRNGGDDAVSNLASTGAAFGIDAGVRLTKLYLGISYEFSTFSDGGQLGTFASIATATQTVTTSTISHYGGIDIGYVGVRPGSRIAPWIETGVGYRVFTPTVKFAETSSPSIFFQLNNQYSGIDVRLGGGIFLDLAPWLRLVPELMVDVGQYGNISGTCTSGGGVTCDPKFTFNQSISNQAFHTFIFAGVGGYYNIDTR